MLEAADDADRTDIELTNSPAAAWPRIIYRLGPDLHILAFSTVDTYPNGRVWVLLDQLLSSPRCADGSDHGESWAASSVRVT